MHPGMDEVRLILVAESQLHHTGGTIKIYKSLYAQGISAIRPDPGA